MMTSKYGLAADNTLDGCFMALNEKFLIEMGGSIGLLKVVVFLILVFQNW